MTDLPALFDNISQQTLMMLEALFVARIPPQDYIAQQNQQGQQIFKIDPFVLKRSTAFTKRSLAASGARQTQKIQAVPYETRSKSAPNQRTQAVKKDHSLTYPGFYKAMKVCFNAQDVQINSIFLQLLHGVPLTQKREFQLMQANQPVDFKGADAVFSGCTIQYIDLLNFITTQTTIVQQQQDVKIEQLKTPQQFAHRLVIEVAEYFAELGVFFTCSRDGLAQLWSSFATNPILNFQEEEEHTFGMTDDKVNGLVKEWTAEQETTGLPRIKNIQVLSQVIKGQIEAGKIDPATGKSAVNLKQPFNLIYSLTDPALDLAAFPLKETAPNYSHELVVACRTADAPLPSGRPMPDRVWRSRRYKGGVYRFQESRGQEYRGGGYTLYSQCRGIPRSKSCQVRRFRDTSSKMGLDEFMTTAFDHDDEMQFSAYTCRGQLNTDTDAFGAYQHPIYQGRQQTAIGKMARQLGEQEQDYDTFEQNLQRNRKLNLDFKQNGRGSSWITTACYYHVERRFYFAVSGGQISVFKLLKNSIELELKIRIQGVALTHMAIWVRQLTRLQVNRVCDEHGIDLSKTSPLSVLPGLYDDEIPQPGDVHKEIGYCVYMSRDMLGFVNLRTNVVVLELRLCDIDENLKDDFFSALCIFGGRLVVGLASGRVLALSPVDFSIATQIQPYANEISAFTFLENSSMLITGNITGCIKIFDYATQPKQTQQLHDSGAILRLFASEKYDIIISVCVNGVITIFSIQQFTQLSKTFVNQNLTVAMWDDDSGILVVGDVEMTVFRIVGTTKKQDESKIIPQAHYCKIVSVINLQDQEDQFNAISTDNIAQEIAFSAPDRPRIVSPTIPDEVRRVRVETGPRFVYPAFRRTELAHRPKFMDDMKPCQPEYKQSQSKTPYSAYEANTEEIEVPQQMSTGKDQQEGRIQLLNAVSACNFQMLNFDAYQEKMGQTLRNKRAIAYKLQTTGIEIMQLCAGISSADSARAAKTILQGFITIDQDANLRHFNRDGEIEATYQLDLLDNQKVMSSCYSSQLSELYLNLSDGKCMTFKIVTSEVLDIYNVANCAKAAYLLQFEGQQLENGDETGEFKQFLKTYKPEKYERPEVSVVYQGQVAVAAGELVLLYSKNARRLSQRFVENMLLSNAKQARQLIPGMTLPPSLILRGHAYNVVAMSAAGKKLITADESGVVCFWFGFGIAKVVMKMSQDYIQSVKASFDQQLWGWVMFKDGQVWQVAMDKATSYLLQFKTSGLKNAIFAVQETQNETIFAFAEENRGTVVKIGGDLSPRSFMLPCQCRITALELVGPDMIASCSSGHVYMGSLRQEDARQASDDVQQLYVVEDGTTVRQNPSFDYSFDKSGLLALRPLIVSIMQQKDGESVVSVDTRRFFEQLEETQREIERNLVLDEECDMRLLSQKTDSSVVKMSNQLINSETVEVARKEALFGVKLNFK